MDQHPKVVKHHNTTWKLGETQKQLADPRKHMVLAIQRWNKIIEDLQGCIHVLVLLNNRKMCKDKWNGFNSDYKKLSNYHKGTRNHTSFWEMTTKKCDKHYLSCQFNKKINETILSFMGRRSLMHHFTWKTCKQKVMRITLC
jgi:superoxide dismutase